jgi:hypothetical protein
MKTVPLRSTKCCQINYSFHRIYQLGAHTIYSILLLAACFMLFSCLAYSSTLKMEATCFSETLVDFQWTTWRYISGDRHFSHSSFVIFQQCSYCVIFFNLCPTRFSTSSICCPRLVSTYLITKIIPNTSAKCHTPIELFPFLVVYSNCTSHPIALKG